MSKLIILTPQLCDITDNSITEMTIQIPTGIHGVQFSFWYYLCRYCPMLGGSFPFKMFQVNWNCLGSSYGSKHRRLRNLDLYPDFYFFNF
jgi:hypothetical protein